MKLKENKEQDYRYDSSFNYLISIQFATNITPESLFLGAQMPSSHVLRQLHFVVKHLRTEAAAERAVGVALLMVK